MNGNVGLSILRIYISELGATSDFTTAINSAKQALAINPQYDDAMAYMNLLIRERADLRDTNAEYQADIAAADDWVHKTLAAKKQKAEGINKPDSHVGETNLEVGVDRNT